MNKVPVAIQIEYHIAGKISQPIKFEKQNELMNSCFMHTFYILIYVINYFYSSNLIYINKIVSIY